VSNAAADDRADYAQHDCPEHRYMHVHHRFRDDPRDQPDKNVPDEMKHTVFLQGLPSERRNGEVWAIKVEFRF
jgi:hypothetical protein